MYEAADSVHQSYNSLYARVKKTSSLSTDFLGDVMKSEKLKRHMLFLVDYGRGTLQRGLNVSILFPGHCWLLLPGERVQIESDASNPLEGYVIEFDVWHIRQADDGDAGDLGMQPGLFPISGSIDTALTEEIRRYRMVEDEKAGTADADSQLFSASLRFMELLEKIWRKSRELSDSRASREAIHRTVAKMEQSYAEPLTRDQLSLLANMSPSYYSFAFKRETGKSPMELLSEIRIRHAKRQLLFSDRKLREIAESVGYRNEFYFSRQFKQLVGVSPNTYARNHYAKHAKISHPFSLHLQSLGLNRPAASLPDRSINIVGLYVEDFLVSLGVPPVLKCVGNSFRQSYLNMYLDGVKEWSLLSFDFNEIAEAKPDLIILGYPDYGNHGRFEQFSRLAPTYSIQKGLAHWDQGIRIIGQLLNRLDRAEAMIADNEQRIHIARKRLKAMAGKTVALVRICNDRHIRLYGGPLGYSGTVLYHDLGLEPAGTVMDKAWNRASGYTRISPEELYELNTDHLFVVADPAGRAYWNQISNSPEWSNLTCVRNRRFYEVRFDIWMTHGYIAHQLKVQDVVRLLANNSI